MATFEAIFYLADGRRRRRRLEAPSGEGLRERIESRWSVHVVALRRIPTPEARVRRLRIRHRSLVSGLDSLEMMLASGVRVNGALKVIGEAAPAGDGQLFWSVLASGVEETGSLAEAARALPRVFSPEMLGILEAHERAGRLKEGLVCIRRFSVRMEETRREALRAVAYPLAVAGASVAVALVLCLFTLPRFAEMLRGIGVSQPGLPTRMLLAFDDGFRGHRRGILAAGLSVPLLAGGALHARLRTIRHRWLLRVPGLGAALLNIALCRLSITYAALAAGGVRVLETLECCSRVVGNALLEQAIGRVAEGVRENEAIGNAFERAGVFPADFVMAVRCGESDLPETFNRLAAHTGAEGAHQLRRALQMLQSALLGSVVLGVLALCMAVFLPVVQIIDEIH